MAHVIDRGLLRGLALREYAPLAGSVLGWLLVAAAVGHADAVRLFAAAIFVRSTGVLAATSTVTPLRKRLRAAPEVRRAGGRRVLAVEALSLALALAALAAIVLLLLAGQQLKTAGLCLLVAIGLPSRNLLMLGAARDFGELHRLVLAWAGAALVGLVVALGGGLEALAVAIGAREWIALVVSIAAARPVRRTRSLGEAPGWQEIADSSLVGARRRLPYRIGKGILAFTLGPVGTIAARTARGLNQHRRLERFTSNLRAVALLFISCMAIAAALVLVLPTPATLLGAASLTRVGAACANLLLWAQFSDVPATTGDWEDDDEDD